MKKLVIGNFLTHFKIRGLEMFLLVFFYRIQLQRKFLMWFAAVVSRKVETSLAQTTAHPEK